jgi:hypothetical protein
MNGLGGITELQLVLNRWDGRVGIVFTWRRVRDTWRALVTAVINVWVL